MIGMRQDFFSMFGHACTISKENTVVSHSLNYMESYEIDVGTHGLFSCSRFRCT